MKYQQVNFSKKILFCLILLFLGLMSASVTHAETYTFVKYIGDQQSATSCSIGSDNGQFNKPSSVAIDSSGNVYVVDNWNNRIQKFDSNGRYLTQWGSLGSGNGQFNNPVGIAIDSSDNVYVSEYYNCRIQKFNSNGGYLTQWGSPGSGEGQFNYLGHVAVDSLGNVYVAECNNNRIQKFSSSDGINYKFVTYIGDKTSAIACSPGSDNGQFNYPIGIVVDSLGNVYVADTHNNRIQKFDSNGGYLAQWGSLGSGNGQFNDPYNVAVDSSGNVYVDDSGDNHRIQKFDSNGGYLAQWGSLGNGEGQFNGPCGAAIDSLGNVYIGDTWNNRVQEFAPETVKDITPPIITASDKQIVLWPANHTYQTVSIKDLVSSVKDTVDLSVDISKVVITSVNSDELEDAPGDGDGNTLNDIVIKDSQTVDLRAERMGEGNGRVYTINYHVSDASGNTAYGTSKVSVPHDQGKGSTAVDDGAAKGYTVNLK